MILFHANPLYYELPSRKSATLWYYVEKFFFFLFLFLFVYGIHGFVYLSLFFLYFFPCRALVNGIYYDPNFEVGSSATLFNYVEQFFLFFFFLFSCSYSYSFLLFIFIDFFL
jgi:hypothetical protein